MVRRDAVQVWLMSTDAPDPVRQRLTRLLDQAEAARAAAYTVDRHRHRYEVVHARVRLILAGCLGLPPQAIRWRRGEHGKPEVDGTPGGVRVNLSHSGTLAAFTVAWHRPVGVDVQAAIPADRAVRLAARYFPPAEARLVATARAGQRADLFTGLWARKEAVVKAAGGRLVEGLAVAVRDADRAGGAAVSSAAVSGTIVSDGTVSRGGVSDGATPRAGATAGWWVRDLPVPHGYRAAVAADGAYPFPVVLHRWPNRTGWPGGAGGWAAPGGRARRWPGHADLIDEVEHLDVV